VVENENVMTSIRADRVRQQRVARAREVFRSHPDYPAVHVKIHEDFAALKEKCPASIPRLADARFWVELAKLNVQAEGYLTLVDDSAYQDAFALVLEDMARKAWFEFSGLSWDMASRSDLSQFREAVAYWTAEGYRRLAPVAGSGKTATVKNSDENTAPVGGGAEQHERNGEVLAQGKQAPPVSIVVSPEPPPGIVQGSIESSALSASGVAEFQEKRWADSEKIRLALEAADRDEKRHSDLVKPEFWERRQAEFEKYSANYGDLAAFWRASQGWILWRGEPPEANEVPEECRQVFNALARKALEGAPRLAALDGEPWQVWVEFMHYRHWPFVVTTIVPGRVQRVWDSAVKDGRTGWTFRDEVKYAKDEPDKWHYGLLLKHVFKASALFCLDLSARTGENSGASAGHEATGPTNDSEDASSAAASLTTERKIDIVPAGNTHVDLLEQIVARKNITIEAWGNDNKIGRTSLFDWKARRLAGTPLKSKVSEEMSAAIENAIERDAKALGLITEIRDSD
jgi:hypothetical protein